MRRKSTGFFLFEQGPRLLMLLVAAIIILRYDGHALRMVLIYFHSVGTPVHSL